MRSPRDLFFLLSHDGEVIEVRFDSCDVVFRNWQAVGTLRVSPDRFMLVAPSRFVAPGSPQPLPSG